MGVVRKRIGRLNTTEFLENGIVRKTSLLEEPDRKNRLLREAVVLEMARSLGLRVPTLLAYGLDESGHEYLDTQQIDGVTLEHMTCGDRSRAFTTVGSQLLQLRSCFEGFGWLNGETRRGDYLSWKQFLIGFHESNCSGILDLSKSLNSGGITELVHRFVPEPAEPYVIHRDLKPGNVLEDNEGITWILDWENSLLGDPLFDIAQFAANYGHGKQWKALVSGYGLDILTPSYKLYEIIALTGVIAFCQQRHAPCVQRRKRLQRMVFGFMGCHCS